MIRLYIRCERYVLGILYHKKKSITGWVLNQNALFTSSKVKRAFILRGLFLLMYQFFNFIRYVTHGVAVI
jgi:hypothetical protein